MLEDVAKIRRVVLACGTVDLRKGIDGLAQIVGSKYARNPFEKGTLFLFCGRRSDRMKGLLWMGSGFLLLYKRFEDGGFQGWRDDAVTQQVFGPVAAHEFVLMFPVHPYTHVNGVDLHRPGFRFVAKPFVDFIRHTPPAAFSIKGIQFLHRNHVGRYDIFGEVIKVCFPLSLGFLLARFSGYDLFRIRFNRGGIINGICFIKERKLPID